MAKISINPGDNIQRIIDASNPRDKILFQPGIYSVDHTIQLLAERYYIGKDTTLSRVGSSDGPMIEVLATPLKTRLQKIIAWIRGLLRLPRTIVKGFTIRDAKTGIRMAGIEGCKVSHISIYGCATGMDFSAHDAS